MRDGERAVEYATRACELSGWNEPSYLQGLAAAYAESGRFGEAVKVQKAILDSPAFPFEQLREARQRLQLYEQGKPFRDE
jgi:hypothetical protein